VIGCAREHHVGDLVIGAAIRVVADRVNGAAVRPPPL
jgi:hypothetical protein